MVDHRVALASKYNLKESWKKMVSSNNLFCGRTRTAAIVQTALSPVIRTALIVQTCTCSVVCTAAAVRAAVGSCASFGGFSKATRLRRKY